MKKSIHIFCFYLGACLSLVAQDLKNPSFEKSSTWILPKEAVIVNDNETNSRFLKVESFVNGEVEFFQDIPVVFSEVNRINISVNIKVDVHTEGIVRLFAKAFNEEDLIINFEQKKLSETTGDWQELKITLMVPSNASKVRVGGRVSGAATANYKNFGINSSKLSQETLVPEVQEYVDSIFSIVEKYALHKEKLNFSDMRNIVSYYMRNAKNIQESYNAMYRLTLLLADNHSQFLRPSQVKYAFKLDTIDLKKLRAQNFAKPKTGIVDSVIKHTDFGFFSLKENKYGYLKVPAFKSLYRETYLIFADTLQNRIKRLDQNKLKGWILDLRDNTGGAFPPMAMGAGPLLDDKNRLYYTTEQGKPESQHYYMNGEYRAVVDEKDSLLFKLPKYYKLKNKNLPLAVLVNGNTGSSGEAMALIFNGQKNVKSFGTNTAGLTSGNGTYYFYDGSLLILTSSYMADRNRKVFKKGFEPDQYIYNSKDSDIDQALKAAIRWIKKEDYESNGKD